jgi:F0F1-type ATP synthase membrane subunit b/b'
MSSIGARLDRLPIGRFHYRLLGLIISKNLEGDSMEWLGLAGVMASFLGLTLTFVFGAYAFLVNGPRTRQMIGQTQQMINQTQQMIDRSQEMIREMHADTQRTLEKMDATLGRMDDTLRYVADLVRAEGERTREEIRTQRV